MALLRIRTPEQLQGHPPGELGVLLGLDRAPEVKTLRRKLWELAGRRQATQFSQRLAERWVREQADAVGLLYVDGHVRPYHGTAHTLPEAWSARRRLCLPATTDIWVNQSDAQPLFAPGLIGQNAAAFKALADPVRLRLLSEALDEVRTEIGLDPDPPRSSSAGAVLLRSHSLLAATLLERLLRLLLLKLLRFP